MCVCAQEEFRCGGQKTDKRWERARKRLRGGFRFVCSCGCVHDSLYLKYKPGNTWNTTLLLCEILQKQKLTAYESNRFWWKLWTTTTTKERQKIMNRSVGEKSWWVYLNLNLLTTGGEEEGCDQQAARPDLNNSGRSAPHISLLHTIQLASKYSALVRVLYHRQTRWQAIRPISLYPYVCAQSSQFMASVTIQILQA